MKSKKKKFRKTDEIHKMLYTRPAAVGPHLGFSLRRRHLPGAEKPKWQMVSGLCVSRARECSSIPINAVSWYRLMHVVYIGNAIMPVYMAPEVDRSVVMAEHCVQKYRNASAWMQARFEDLAKEEWLKLDMHQPQSRASVVLPL